MGLEMAEDVHRVVRAGRALELSPTEYLLAKLGDPSLLHTVRGFGYVLRAPGT